MSHGLAHLRGRENYRASEYHLGVFQPDTLLPSQLFETAPGQPLPEKRLMVAILDDAIHCFQKYRTATEPRRRRLFREAEKWIMYEVTDWPFSFTNICHVLGLDPDYVRGGLLRRGDECSSAATP